MARTPAGKRLTDLHRTTQARIATELAATLLPLWRILDIQDLKGTSEAWIAAAIGAIEASRATSIATTGAYLRAFRLLEAKGAAPFTLPTAPALDHGAAATSLLVTGPYALMSKVGAGMPLERAVSQAFAGSTSSAGRLALNGGRELTLGAIKADPRATSYQRITSPGACAFCEEIASVSDGDFQCHDGCNCQAEPVYG